MSFAFAGPDNERNGETIEKEIAALKLANQGLKRQVEELEERLARLEFRHHRSKDLSIDPDKNSIPKNWQRREFNGQPYYVVPLLDSLDAEVKVDSFSRHGDEWSARSR